MRKKKKNWITTSERMYNIFTPSYVSYDNTNEFDLVACS